jgi:uncharacterized coiled-coil protein SlyX
MSKKIHKKSLLDKLKGGNTKNDEDEEHDTIDEGFSIFLVKSGGGMYPNTYQFIGSGKSEEKLKKESIDTILKKTRSYVAPIYLFNVKGDRINIQNYLLSRNDKKYTKQGTEIKIKNNRDDKIKGLLKTDAITIMKKIKADQFDKKKINYYPNPNKKPEKKEKKKPVKHILDKEEKKDNQLNEHPLWPPKNATEEEIKIWQDNEKNEFIKGYLEELEKHKEKEKRELKERNKTRKEIEMSMKKYQEEKEKKTKEKKTKEKKTKEKKTKEKKTKEEKRSYIGTFQDVADLSRKFQSEIDDIYEKTIDSFDSVKTEKDLNKISDKLQKQVDDLTNKFLNMNGVLEDSEKHKKNKIPENELFIKDIKKGRKVVLDTFGNHYDVRLANIKNIKPKE